MGWHRESCNKRFLTWQLVRHGATARSRSATPATSCHADVSKKNEKCGTGISIKRWPKNQALGGSILPCCSVIMTGSQVLVLVAWLAPGPPWSGNWRIGGMNAKLGWMGWVHEPRVHRRNVSWETQTHAPSLPSRWARRLISRIDTLQLWISVEIWREL